MGDKMIVDHHAGANSYTAHQHSDLRYSRQLTTAAYRGSHFTASQAISRESRDSKVTSASET